MARIGPDIRVRSEVPDYARNFSQQNLLSGIQPGEQVEVLYEKVSRTSEDKYRSKTFRAPAGETGDTFETTVRVGQDTRTVDYELTSPEDAEILPRKTRTEGWKFPTHFLSNEEILSRDLPAGARQAFRKGIGLPAEPEPTAAPEPAAPEPNTTDLSASSQSPTPDSMSAFPTVAAIVGAVVLAVAVIGN